MSLDSCTEPSELEGLFTEGWRETPEFVEVVPRAVANAARADEAFLITAAEGGETL